MRADLPYGLAAAEIVHAAGESAALSPPAPDCHAVVLTADAAELNRLAATLAARGIPLRCIYEDAEPYRDAVVAIGIAPGAAGASRWLRHLPLLRGPPAAPV